MMKINSEFGLLFHLAAERTGTKITHHGFDNAVVQVHQDDMTKFMDYLNSVMLTTSSKDDDETRSSSSKSKTSTTTTTTTMIDDDDDED